MAKKARLLSLKEQLEDKNRIIILPGVFDALSARIAEQVGFDAMFQTGYGSSAALLGMPDFGFLNAGETVDNARRIIRAVSVPVLVDADTGYGNPLNVWRLVQDLESLGAAGIFLEDQIWPKRCGHMIGKDVIPKDEYLPKLKAAVEARKSKDFIIVARTDARAPISLDEAIERGKAYKKAGADVIFVEAPRSVEELKRVADEIDAPLVANMIEDGVTPTLPAQELLKLGYRIAVFPLSALYSATYAMREVLTELKKTGATKETRKMMVTFKDFNRFVDLDKYMNLEKRYT
ncbi:isocitrate lyase /carboxyphosphonoenolpyruvate phosphonomutase [Candidatus Nitrososphaera gargensis Ga9.2]|uniref:Isocitrate lyase /carboxyphosphonoenolpyruvate phosphonomutase n=1 Tax=Nitrososphaera gargensis (strain Ga9.2) TaxID=1237085 RepID=K0IIC6_NITGG|nr:isocitrate lyase/PEP mutase family protein [Candidatus Nitrososphaera gargensis]AFU58723.1 isocitrate lyase /carboxyphosphonoenolpyruvate phosphonomutase [Candidatus Nitrososphaera gargensis Ga9.2]